MAGEVVEQVLALEDHHLGVLRIGFDLVEKQKLLPVVLAFAAEEDGESVHGEVGEVVVDIGVVVDALLAAELDLDHVRSFPCGLRVASAAEPDGARDPVLKLFEAGTGKRWEHRPDPSSSARGHRLAKGLAAALRVLSGASPRVRGARQLPGGR